MTVSAAAKLPGWNLDDLYPGADSPELKADLDKVDAMASTFAADFAGRMAEQDGAGFRAALAAYEEINEILGRILSFAQLRHATAVTDPEVARFQQNIAEKATVISQKTLFFTLEINRVDDARIALWLGHPEVARYEPWISHVRAFRAHQLSDEAENLLHEREVVGRGAWNRLFDETLAAMRFPWDGGELTTTEAFDKFSDPDRAVRARAGRVIAGVLRDNARITALVTNVLAKDKQIDDDRRGYARPVSPRNLANQVEDEVVDALVAAVTQAYPRLSHRYYALKAKWLGLDRLAHSDRNAPLPGDDNKRYSWDDAVKLVMGAYGRFSPELAATAQPFFDKPWIDVPVRPGKASGAFAHPTVPSAHPYLMLNYMGRSRDVMTLAHELGHGVHQRLAAAQGTLLSDTPLTLAETASVFGEMLTFRAVLDATSDPAARRILLANKVEDMLNTVVRQIAFHQFETRVHAERRGGELSVERLGEIWLDVQSESLGPAFDFDDDYRIYWSYIPHFIHVPFYVYAYAFGDCLVNALYGVYQSGHPGFAAKYLDMLRAGGTKRHRELLAPFGLDAADPSFWSIGLDVVAGLIDELEALDR
ncbi:Oligoendopeptidase F [uncultured Alphaproteobacteria bacterium]|uniref:Oligoendopeptidase F n=1 Tax=uncultured Alphaproteobacteria bacterium TaxID=91750 RepID=A0A212JEZ1_9PROT|nr:Oligoendopeptidase F [uncultured Alphaproteobacteria bacterium]